MNSSLEWFDLMETALEHTMVEVSSSPIDSAFLFSIEDDNAKFIVNKTRIDKNYLSIFDKAWSILTQILTNELQLMNWKTLTISGRTRALSIKLLTPYPKVFLTLIHDVNFDTNDFMKIFMKQIIEHGYKTKYETAGLVASEGYPIWVVSETQQIDEYLFAISITSLLTLVERIDMEVAAGGVLTCIVHGNENLQLNVAFNPSKDLAFAVTQRTSGENLAIDEELQMIYANISDPILYNANVPETQNPEREKILSELREESSGEITEEEMQSLNIFDTETLDSLVNEIMSVARNFGANEISIGYLRKRMKLPAEVLHMALEYLISTNAILGRIGREKHSGQEILVIQPQKIQSEEEFTTIQNIQQQVNDLFLPLDPFLARLPIVQKMAETEVISEALSEFQVLQSLSDTDSLFLQSADLRILASQFERSVMTITMLQDQVTENQDNPAFVQELKGRLDKQIEKFTEQRSSIATSGQKLYSDLLNSYRILLKLLPAPSSIKYNKAIDKISLVFKCKHALCKNFLYKYDETQGWRKIIYFAQVLKIIESFPEGWEQLDQEKMASIDLLYSNLRKITDSDQQLSSIESFTFLNELDDLILSNAERDKMVSALRQALDQSNDQADYYSTFRQCNNCQKWYCSRHIRANDLCIYC
ncbi:MAG: hypothetical protein ACW98I_00230 [Candidatus Hodarchaeales archaeon]